jgi:hypothetical protein
VAINAVTTLNHHLALADQLRGGIGVQSFAEQRLGSADHRYLDATLGNELVFDVLVDDRVGRDVTRRD